MQFNQGGCLCSAIRFRVSGRPAYSVVCHCATCRRAHSAPTVAWLTFEREQVNMLSGRPQIYRSSQGVVRQFCGACGSQISYQSAERPTTIDITTASLDNPTLFPPTCEVWLEQRVTWHTADPARAQYLRSME